MTEKEQQQLQSIRTFLLALNALRNLVHERGVEAEFTPDEIWDRKYIEEEVLPHLRPPQIVRLIDGDYMQRTGRRGHASSPSRRGNRVDMVQAGPRLSSDHQPPLWFYRLKGTGEQPPQLPVYAIPPCMSLIPLGHSDDISSSNQINKYRTSFELWYHAASDEAVQLGIVKILQQSAQGVRSQTSLPNIFVVLNRNFVSLGQSMDYYEQLKKCGETIYEPVLSGLNDIVYAPSLKAPFENDRAWNASLLRFSEAEKAYREARSFFHSDTSSDQAEKILRFDFTCQVLGASEPHKLSFDFSEDPTELYRIAAIIGRNGTGKTQVLAQFASAMSGHTLGRGSFEPERPSFSKVIAISYSIFDEFERPAKKETTFSYIYCGIRQGNRLLSQQEIRQKLFDLTAKIMETIRYDRWKEIIKTLLNLSSLPSRSASFDEKFYDRLSSGQRILALVMTEVIHNITNDSIILFDEPEIHLHPEAIAALTRSLHLLLDEFKSYAIIATHSPMILQEIPSKFVTVLRRQGNLPIVNQLYFESFGENLSNITDDVFETGEDRYNYRTHLRKLASQKTYEEIMEMFDNRLSFNARAFLSTLYKQR